MITKEKKDNKQKKDRLNTLEWVSFDLEMIMSEQTQTTNNLENKIRAACWFHSVTTIVIAFSRPIEHNIIQR